MKALIITSKILLSIFLIPSIILIFPLVFFIMLAVSIELEGWENIRICELFNSLKNGFIESYHNLIKY